MPTKGKCWSCGKTRDLTGKLLKHIEDGHLEFHMVCAKCAKYFESIGDRTA